MFENNYGICDNRHYNQENIVLIKWIREKLIPDDIDSQQSANFKVPVLCYHSWTIDGSTYGTNDHTCLESDLATLADRGYEVLPVTALIDVLEGRVPAKTLTGKKLVCLTFDDGRDFDYVDYHSEKAGYVKSFYSIIKDSQDFLTQSKPGYMAVSFVIASPEARSILDQTCGESKGEWQDSWWKTCAEEGVLGIANHSWDHVHDTLPQVRQRDNLKGSFYEITTFEDAESQIACAQEYIDGIIGGKSVPVFCYPYGHVSAYLRDEYFPEHGSRLGLRGAFSTEGGPVGPDTCIWDIPRFVCGAHWKTQEEFNALLESIECAKQ